MLKILIVTQNEPFYVPCFFESFLEKFSEDLSGIEILGVIMQRPLGQRSKKALLRKMVDLYGPIVFPMISIKYIILKVKNKLNKLGLLTKANSTEYFCHKYGVRILRYTNVNHPKFTDFVKDNKVDLIISVAASQIFKPEILRAPRKGCINIHNAPLPNYRGMMPIFWQIYHGETYAVTTIHEMVEELDKGRIILQDRTRIEKGMTLDRLIKITKQRSANALARVLEMYISNKVRFMALSDDQGSYFSFPTGRDVHEFRKRGYRVI